MPKEHRKMPIHLWLIQPLFTCVPIMGHLSFSNLASVSFLTPLLLLISAFPAFLQGPAARGCPIRFLLSEFISH